MAVGWADQAIRGLQDLMLKRAKEEVILAVQRGIQKRVCGDDIGRALLELAESRPGLCTEARGMGSLLDEI